MGSPQPPTAAQYAELEKAGKLQTLGAPGRVSVEGGALRTTFSLPRQGVSLLKFVY
jgi:xylan 1,4-beta-xylosidase